MGIVKTKGIVIKTANSKDNDKVLTVLTADLGKISVFCRGAKKNKSAFLSCSEVLSYSDMVLFSGNSELYNLQSAELIEVFYNLRMDIDKLSYVATILKIMNDVCVEGEIAYQKLQLLLNTLYVLSETDKDLDLVFATFKIRLLGILGFIPRLATCISCEEKVDDKNELFFSIKDDGVKCGTCAKLDKSAIKISNITYTALLYVLSADAKKLFSFDIPKEAISELNLVAKLYTDAKLEKEYDIGL